MSISTNQIVGFMNIESRNKSNLIEKGLKENENYNNLNNILLKVLNLNETRRYEFRKNTKRGRIVTNISKILYEMFLALMKISVILHKENIDAHVIEKV